jgi:hypothetical protein
MTRQTAQPLREYRTAVISGVAYEIVNSMRPFLILDPPYQRGTVWTGDQRIALVRSWLMNLTVPSVILNDRSRSIWQDEKPTGEQHLAIVDGRQRIETAMLWFDGAFAVPASWFDPEWVESTVDTDDGPYVAWDNLTRGGRTMAKTQWKLPRLETMLATVTEEAELYLLINGGGTPQTAADMANAAKVAGR